MITTITKNIDLVLNYGPLFYIVAVGPFWSTTNTLEAAEKLVCKLKEGGQYEHYIDEDWLC